MRASWQQSKKIFVMLLALSVSASSFSAGADKKKNAKTRAAIENQLEALLQQDPNLQSELNMFQPWLTKMQGEWTNNPEAVKAGATGYLAELDQTASALNAVSTIEKSHAATLVQAVPTKVKEAVLTKVNTARESATQAAAAAAAQQAAAAAAAQQAAAATAAQQAAAAAAAQQAAAAAAAQQAAAAKAAAKAVPPPTLQQLQQLQQLVKATASSANSVMGDQANANNTVTYHIPDALDSNASANQMMTKTGESLYQATQVLKANQGYNENVANSNWQAIQSSINGASADFVYGTYTLDQDIANMLTAPSGGTAKRMVQTDINGLETTEQQVMDTNTQNQTALVTNQQQIQAQLKAVQTQFDGSGYVSTAEAQPDINELMAQENTIAADQLAINQLNSNMTDSDTFSAQEEKLNNELKNSAVAKDINSDLNHLITANAAVISKNLQTITRLQADVKNATALSVAHRNALKLQLTALESQATNDKISLTNFLMKMGQQDVSLNQKNMQLASQQLAAMKASNARLAEKLEDFISAWADPQLAMDQAMKAQHGHQFMQDDMAAIGDNPLDSENALGLYSKHKVDLLRDHEATKPANVRDAASLRGYSDALNQRREGN
ncbi:MAG: hypothetical protein DHS20C10_11120 [marine bacterium B5-7]|nr:MAG: hypothetical protein DHS20C10_11120 [marine bacterium B5-7]